MKGGQRKWHERLKVTLWTLVIPPSVWAAHFLCTYLWAAISCAKVGRFAEFPTLFAVATLLAMAVIGLSGWIAWRQARTAGDPGPHDQGTDIDRLRFLAKSTLLLSGLSFIAVLFTALPVLFIGDCR